MKPSTISLYRITIYVAVQIYKEKEDEVGKNLFL